MRQMGDKGIDNSASREPFKAKDCVFFKTWQVEAFILIAQIWHSEAIHKWDTHCPSLRCAYRTVFQFLFTLKYVASDSANTTRIKSLSLHFATLWLKNNYPDSFWERVDWVEIISAKEKHCNSEYDHYLNQVFFFFGIICWFIENCFV